MTVASQNARKLLSTVLVNSKFDISLFAGRIRVIIHGTHNLSSHWLRGYS